MSQPPAGADGPVAAPQSQPQPAGSPPLGGTGFSDTEKLIGAVAGYQAPLVSSLAASYLLRTETDPQKRRQLETLRKWSLGWLAVGIGVAIIGVIVFVSFASSHGVGSVGSACRGGIDTLDPEGTTYLSSDGKHWTATYPCTDGGRTTVPVPARSVPVGSDFS